MGVCNRQPLAESKGVHREVESEGSLRQNSAPRHTNHIRHSRWGKVAKRTKAQRLHRQRSVNMAETWKESKDDLPREASWTCGNSVRSTDNSSHEESAEAIVVGKRAIYREYGRSHEL